MRRINREYLGEKTLQVSASVGVVAVALGALWPLFMYVAGAMFVVMALMYIWM